MSVIEIVGLLILLYTVYLILADSGKKNNNSEPEDKVVQEKTADSNKNTQKPVKHEKSVPVQTIESNDEPDVLRQGRGYTEQVSSEEASYTPPVQQHFEEQSVDKPSTKNEEVIKSEYVSVKCPYCDNNVLVPKGGSAECSCCSSRLNDNGSILD